MDVHNVPVHDEEVDEFARDLLELWRLSDLINRGCAYQAERRILQEKIKNCYQPEMRAAAIYRAGEMKREGVW